MITNENNGLSANWKMGCDELAIDVVWSPSQWDTADVHTLRNLKKEGILVAVELWSLDPDTLLSICINLCFLPWKTLNSFPFLS